MRRSAFSMCAIAFAAEMLVIAGSATAQTQPMNPPPPTTPQPGDPSMQPKRPGMDPAADREMDPAERERMQREWDGMKKEWEKLTPEQRLLSILRVKNAHEVEMGQLGVSKGTSAAVKDFASMMVRDHRANNDRIRSVAASENLTLWDPQRTERGLKLMKMFDKDAQAEHKDGDKDAKRDHQGDKDRKDRDPSSGAPMPGGQPSTTPGNPSSPSSPSTQPGTDRRDDDRRDPAGKKHHDPMARLRTLSGDEFDRAYAYHMYKGHTELLSKLEKLSASVTNANVKAFAAETTATVTQHKEQAGKLPGAMDAKSDKGWKDGDKERKDWDKDGQRPQGTPPAQPSMPDRKPE